jgi:hypothetical protein
MRSFCKSKRVWLKAFKILEEIVLLATESEENTLTIKERNIFRYQFVLNYMSKKPEELLNFVESNMQFITHYATFIQSKLVPLLELKSQNQNLGEAAGLPS